MSRFIGYFIRRKGGSENGGNFLLLIFLSISTFSIAECVWEQMISSVPKEMRTIRKTVHEDFCLHN